MKTAEIFDATDATDAERAAVFYRERGYVVMRGVFAAHELAGINVAIADLVTTGRHRYWGEAHQNFDIVMRDPTLEAVCRHDRLCGWVRRLLGHPIELQHAKLKAKPLHPAPGKGEVALHQDFPFFPHTNYDLIAAAIHLDDEEEDSGNLYYLPGSHRDGVRSHCEQDRFAYACTESPSIDDAEAVRGGAGLISFHHGLTLHGSGPNANGRMRRLLVLQYRAQDAIQLAGPVWQSTGMAVAPPERKGWARFPDGTSIEIRGVTGRLYDLYGAFAPSR